MLEVAAHGETDVIDPAAPTRPDRFEMHYDWSIAHGAVTQWMDHIIVIPFPTSPESCALHIATNERPRRGYPSCRLRILHVSLRPLHPSCLHD